MDLRSDNIDRSNFTFHEVIGEGGCGTVYRATFKERYKNHSEAAAKSLTHLRIEEIEILRRLRHDNIVTMLGYFEDGPMKVIFFEYTPHGSLHQYLAKDPSTQLPNDLRRRWAKEAALPLKYLHIKKILHRDIKSANCLLFDGVPGTLKLCDFGLAKDVDHSQTTSTQQGTYRFMAPEIILTDDRDHAVFSKATEVWAYGMLLLEICTRKLPFSEEEWFAVVLGVGGKKKVPNIPADCPEELAYIMKRCWKFEPKERPTIDRIVKDLMNASELTQQWRIIKTIRPMDNKIKLKANRISCCPNGDIVAADNYVQHRQYVLTHDGRYKAPLIMPYQMDFINGIAITIRGHIANVSWSTDFVAVFNHNAKFLSKFPVARTTTDHSLTGITVDSTGKLLVWDSQRQVVSCHSCPDGKLVKEVKVTKKLPDLPRLAAHENKLIFYDDNASAGNDTKVVAMDYFGKEIFTINPEIGDRDTGKTYKGMQVGLCGLVVDKNGDMFIAMKVCIANIDIYATRIGRTDTGHIHRYNGAGEFQQCIFQGLHSPHDLAITSDGSLMIADDNEIQKCSQVTVTDADDKKGRRKLSFEDVEMEEITASTSPCSTPKRFRSPSPTLIFGL